MPTDRSPEWGWLEDQIRIIDDLGRSRTNAAGRPSYQAMLRDICRGVVGIVMEYDHSRRNRNVFEEAVLRSTKRRKTNGR